MACGSVLPRCASACRRSADIPCTRVRSAPYNGRTLRACLGSARDPEQSLTAGIAANGASPYLSTTSSSRMAPSTHPMTRSAQEASAIAVYAANATGHGPPPDHSQCQARCEGPPASPEAWEEVPGGRKKTPSKGNARLEAPLPARLNRPQPKRFARLRNERSSSPALPTQCREATLYRPQTSGRPPCSCDKLSQPYQGKTVSNRIESAGVESNGQLPAIRGGSGPPSARTVFGG